MTVAFNFFNGRTVGNLLREYDTQNYKGKAEVKHCIWTGHLTTPYELRIAYNTSKQKKIITMISKRGYEVWLSLNMQYTLRLLYRC